MKLHKITLFTTIFILLVVGFFFRYPTEDLSLETVYVTRNTDSLETCRVLTSSVTVSLPVITKSKGRRTKINKINRQLIVDYLGQEYAQLSPQEAIDKYTTDQLALLTQEEQLSQQKQDSLRSNYFIRNMVKGELINNRILCIECFYAEGKGELKTCSSYKNIDLESGEVLSLVAIFKQDYERNLKSLIIDRFRSAYQYSRGDDLLTQEILKLELLLDLDNNFRLNEEGILFVCSLPKEVKLAEGNLQIMLSKEAIKPLLKSRFHSI